MRLGGRRLLGATNALIYLYLLAPILIVIPVSFSAAAFVVFPPRGLSLRWYVNFLQSRELTEALGLSLRLAVAVTLAATVARHPGCARPRALSTARPRAHPDGSDGAYRAAGRWCWALRC